MKMKLSVVFVVNFVMVIMLVTAVEAVKKKKDRKMKTKKYSGKCKPHIMAEYELTFQGFWSAALYPKMYPRYRPPAQWSKLIGRTHGDGYRMWEEGSLAQPSVRAFAENADTSGFDSEAQSFSGLWDTFTAAPIRGGTGRSMTNFLADGRHAKLSLMVKVQPSPDWFVGLSSLDLCEKKRWKSDVAVDLFPLDAGTDRGLSFTSPDWPSKPQETIYRLSPTQPLHSASAFFYTDRVSLPPIARVVMKKVGEYRRKGKTLPPLKQEPNVIIDGNAPDPHETKLVIPQLEMLTNEVVEISSRQNEILAPRAEALVAAEDPGCIVSDWSDWTPCSQTCGFGRQERRRTIIRRAVQAGLYCPVLREDRTCGTMKSCEWESFQFLKRNG